MRRAKKNTTKIKPKPIIYTDNIVPVFKLYWPLTQHGVTISSNDSNMNGNNYRNVTRVFDDTLNYSQTEPHTYDELIKQRYIQIQFLDTTKKVEKYSVGIRNDRFDTAPRVWDFKGSNDGVNWITLHKVLDAEFIIAGSEKEYFFVNNNNYSFYRWEFINNNTTHWMDIFRLKMMEVLQK